MPSLVEVMRDWCVPFMGCVCLVFFKPYAEGALCFPYVLFSTTGAMYAVYHVGGHAIQLVCNFFERIAPICVMASYTSVFFEAGADFANFSSTVLDLVLVSDARNSGVHRWVLCFGTDQVLG